MSTMPPPVPKVRLQWPQCFALSETFLMVWVTLKWVECFGELEVADELDAGRLVLFAD